MGESSDIWEMTVADDHRPHSLPQLLSPLDWLPSDWAAGCSFRGGPCPSATAPRWSVPGLLMVATFITFARIAGFATFATVHHH